MRTLLLLSVLVSTLWGQAQLAEAAALARAGRFAEARSKLTGVTEPQEITQRIAFHRLCAAVASGLGEPQKAVEEMRAALQLAPGDRELLVGAAMTETQAGHFEEALKTAQQAGEYAPAKALQGDIEEKRGRVQEALTAYRAAVALDPKSEKFRIALALELIEHQAMSQAQKTLQEAFPLFPYSGILRTLLGVSLYGMGEIRAAEDTLTDAVRSAPEYAPAYRCLTQIVLESSAAPTADSTAALCRWNSIVCDVLRLRQARSTGDEALWRRAVTALEQAPAGNAVASCALAQAYAWKQKWEEARARGEICVRLDPTPQQHYHLSQIYKRLGQDELARQQLSVRQKLLDKMSEQTAQGLAALRVMEIANPQGPNVR